MPVFDTIHTLTIFVRFFAFQFRPFFAIETNKCQQHDTHSFPLLFLHHHPDNPILQVFVQDDVRVLAMGQGGQNLPVINIFNNLDLTQ